MQIHVRLIDEAVDVWAPVQAAHQHEDVYRILQQSYDPAEPWQFVPGDLVRCEPRDFDSGRVLVAVELA